MYKHICPMIKAVLYITGEEMEFLINGVGTTG